RHGDAALAQAVTDVGNGGCRLVAVDGDAHQFGPCPRQRRHLLDGARHIGGVGVGPRLHDDRRATTDGNLANLDLGGFVPRLRASDVDLGRLFGLVHDVSNIRFWAVSAMDQSYEARAGSPDTVPR